MNSLLIVDDDVELCALLIERLAEDGFDLAAVHNGIDGLELASSGSYSLVILDVMLPRMGESMYSNSCARALPYPS